MINSEEIDLEYMLLAEIDQNASNMKLHNICKEHGLTQKQAVALVFKLRGGEITSKVVPQRGRPKGVNLVENVQFQEVVKVPFNVPTATDDPEKLMTFYEQSAHQILINQMMLVMFKQGQCNAGDKNAYPEKEFKDLASLITALDKVTGISLRVNLQTAVDTLVKSGYRVIQSES